MRREGAQGPSRSAGDHPWLKRLQCPTILPAVRRTRPFTCGGPSDRRRARPDVRWNGLLGLRWSATFLDRNVGDLLRLDGSVLDSEPVEHQFPAVLFHGNEDLVHVLVGQSERFIDSEKAAQLFSALRACQSRMTTLRVEDDIPEDPEIAHGVTADFVGGDALGLREPWTNLVLPVREQEDEQIALACCCSLEPPGALTAR